MQVAHRPREILHLRQDEIFEPRRVADEGIGRGHPLHGRVQPRKALVGDPGGELGAVTPRPRVLVATSTLLVLVTDVVIASQSTGERLRRSITSTLTPSRSSSSFAATSERCTTAP